MNPSSSSEAASLLLSVLLEEKSRRKQLAYSAISRPATAKLPSALSASITARNCVKRVKSRRHEQTSTALASFSPRSVLPNIFSYMMASTRHVQIGKYAPLCLLLIAMTTSGFVAASTSDGKNNGEQKSVDFAKHLTALNANQQQSISPAEFAEMCAKFPALNGCHAQEVEKRKSAYMRFGRSPQSASEDDGAAAYDNFEKRKSAYMRFGKRFSPYEGGEFEQYSALPAMDKRKSAYMRFGKRKSAYMRFGKRSDMDEYDNMNAMEKRKSAYMRFGKRSLLAPSGVDKTAAIEMEKRKSAYMRFGRK